MPAKSSSARMITIRVFAVSVLLPIAVFAQAVPVLAPGLHSLTLQRANEPAIHYAISIPDNYSPPARVPLILALHFGSEAETRPAPAATWSRFSLVLRSRSSERLSSRRIRYEVTGAVPKTRAR